MLTNNYFSPCSYGQYYGYGNGFGSYHDGWVVSCCCSQQPNTGLVKYYTRRFM